ncbi:MAG: transposase [Flavobacteriales bacterium]|nr:transposase [Flavobacteriales bacterium]
MGPVNVAQAYKQRWQIEILFKRLKQNRSLPTS